MQCEFRSNRMYPSFQEKKPNEELPQKLKPIIVTEKKIISLKKKSDTKLEQSSTTQSSDQLKTRPIARKVGTAIVSSDNTATIKPSVKKSIILSDDEIDEDELLDEPINNASKNTSTMFTNRRIVVRNTNDPPLHTTEGAGEKASATSISSPTTAAANAASSHKGIFDRLDNKVTGIGVNDAAKRKIQRIVINK